MSVLLAKLSWLYEFLRLAGVVFLIYLGARMLMAAWTHKKQIHTVRKVATRRSPFLVGFLVGMTNPKTAMFFGSLFLMLLPADAPAWLHVLSVAIVSVITILWLGFLAFSFSLPQVQSVYLRIRRPVDALMGAALMALGARLAVSR